MPGEGAVIEGFREGAGGLDAALQTLHLVFDCRGVEIVQFALRLGSVLHPTALGKAADQHVRQLRELLEVHAAAALRLPGEARHALRHVGLESDPLLLAVIADVHAGGGLLFDHLQNGAVHLPSHQVLYQWFSFLPVDQEVGKHVVARKAAYMGGEDAIAASQHVVFVSLWLD